MRWFLVLLLLLGAPAAIAQVPAPRPAAAAPAAPLPAAPQLTPQQVQQVLEVLRDPARRAQFIAVLETLAKAGAPTAAVPPPDQAETAPAQTEPPATAPATADPVPLAPDSLGAQLIFGVSERLARLTDDAMEAARTVTGLPLIALWLVQLATDPMRQAALLAALWPLAAVLGSGLAAEWLVARLLRPLRRRLAAAAPAPAAAAPPEEAAEVAAAPVVELEARQSARIWRRVRRSVDDACIIVGSGFAFTARRYNQPCGQQRGGGDQT